MPIFAAFRNAFKIEELADVGHLAALEVRPVGDSGTGFLALLASSRARAEAGRCAASHAELLFSPDIRLSDCVEVHL